jgi:hypothetical protein
VRAGIDDEDFIAHLDVLIAAILRSKFDSYHALLIGVIRRRLQRKFRGLHEGIDVKVGFVEIASPPRLAAVWVHGCRGLSA